MKLSNSTSEKNPTKGPIAVKIHVHLGKQHAKILSSKWKALGHSLTVHTLKRCWLPSSGSLYNTLLFVHSVVLCALSPLDFIRFPCALVKTNFYYIITNNFPALKRSNAQKKVP